MTNSNVNSMNISAITEIATVIATKFGLVLEAEYTTSRVTLWNLTFAGLSITTIQKIRDYYYIDLRKPVLQEQDIILSFPMKSKGVLSFAQTVDLLNSDHFQTSIFEQIKQYRSLQKSVRKGYIDTL